MLDNLLFIMYPPFCRACQIPIGRKQIFCALCNEQIKRVACSFIPVTKKYALAVHALSGYTDPLRRLVLRKMNGDLVASKQLGHLMGEKLYRLSLDADYLVPVPLHWTRYAWRGFNQAHEMAKVISKQSGVPVLNCLKRVRRTRFQSRLPIDQRAQNVKSVFVIKQRYGNSLQEIWKNKKILLIDDLCTTGATLKSTARVLVNYRPKSVSALVACRAR